MCLAVFAVGGLVAVGVDPTGRYLLIVSHAGRGVFDTSSWRRVGRSHDVVYPDGGYVEGVEPIAGARIAVSEIDYDTGVLDYVSPDRSWSLHYQEGTVTVESSGT
jgi:hypothetical protein